MHITDVDLNLLRLFDAVHRTRHVSRAAESQGLTQPAASQGLRRLRALLADPLFVRSGGGVRPTPKAEALAPAVRQALQLLEQALGAVSTFDPMQSGKTFRLHLNDIGESHFLPRLMRFLRREAPGVRLESHTVPQESIADALDSGRIDFAIGFLPGVEGMRKTALLSDHYAVLLRAGHPIARSFRAARRQGADGLACLQALELVVVRSHSDTQRMLEQLGLSDRIRLTCQHFLALPGIVQATDLGVVMPSIVARTFVREGGHVLIEPDLPLRDFTVHLHWSRRHEDDPAHRWLREQVQLFWPAA